MVKVLVMGYGVSGKAAASFLRAQGVEVIVVDKKPLPDVLPDREDLPLEGIAQLILSPGIPFTHPLVQKASAQGIEIIGEMELGLRFLQKRGQICYGITGSNGKTTTVLLTAHILNQAGKKARALGNVGTPLTSSVNELEPEEIVILELSSFQLETVQARCLEAAIVLNITPNHLDRYASMQEYVAAKARIQVCLKEGAPLYISKEIQRDYPEYFRGALFFEKEVAGIYREGLKNRSMPRRRPDFEPGKAGAEAAKLEKFSDASGSQKQWLSDAGRTDSSITSGINELSYTQLAMPSKQSVQAAYLICKRCKVSDDLFLEGLKTFQKPAHRIEWVAEIDGVSYYNDSKSSNIHSVMHAIERLKRPVVLILGGVHKGSSYLPWVASFRGVVRSIVAYGQAAEQMERELAPFFPFTRVDRFADAVLTARRLAQKEETVLLSPGCSSYDQFTSFEHRGEEFKRLVKQLQEGKI